MGVGWHSGGALEVTSSRHLDVPITARSRFPLLPLRKPRCGPAEDGSKVQHMWQDGLM